MNDGEASFVSDRDKGLKKSISSEFPEALNLSCSQHLAENVCSKFGRGVAGLFRKLAMKFSQSNPKLKRTLTPFQEKATLTPSFPGLAKDSLSFCIQ